MTSKILAIAAGLAGVLMLGGCATHYGDARDRAGYNNAAYRSYYYDGPVAPPRMARRYGPPGAYAYDPRMERELRRRFRDGRFRVRREGPRLALEMPADILFDLDSADVRPEAQEAIRSVAETLKHFPGTDVDINGYTDTSGTMAHNQALSETRANAVADELAQDGIDPQSIRAEGYGEDDLAVPTPDGVREAANRRVEIVFLPPQRRGGPPDRNGPDRNGPGRNGPDGDGPYQIGPGE
jgi:outer membrane protein OmpA-like peptidoglycan-associated protein